MAALLPASAGGSVLTVRITLLVAEHALLSVTVTVYVVVTVGLAIGLAILALLKLPEGDHK